MGYLDYPGLQRYHGKVQEEIDELKDDIAQIEPGLSAEAKEALLACFNNVAWINGNGATYYNNLRDALYPDPPEWLWTYDSSDGVLFDDFEYATRLFTDGEVSTALGEGGMRFYAEASATGNGVQYLLTPNTSNNAVLEAEVKFFSIPVAQAGRGFMLMVGDGVSSAVMYAHKRPSDNKTFLGTYEYYSGSMHWSDLYEISYNTSYVLWVELSNSTAILKVNGTEILHSSNLHKSTYNYQNLLNVSTPADRTAGASWLALNWLRYKELSSGE